MIQPENMIRIDKLLTAGQVAEILSISRSFVYQLMNRGDIITVRFGKAIRVRPEDLENFIVENLSAGQNGRPDFD